MGRVVETDNPSKWAAGDDARGFPDDGRTANPQSSKSLHRQPEGVYPTAVTLGWRLTCAHADADCVPCTVLDPFAGSGTALYMTQSLGLSPSYCALIPERCRPEVLL